MSRPWKHIEPANVLVTFKEISNRDNLCMCSECGKGQNPENQVEDTVRSSYVNTPDVCSLCPLQVISRWEQYMSKVKPKQGKTVEAEAVASFFPFHKYFSNAPQPVFRGRSYEEDMDIAEGCYRHVKKIFTQLEVRTHACTHTLSVMCLLMSGSPATLSHHLFSWKTESLYKIPTWTTLYIYVWWPFGKKVGNTKKVKDMTTCLFLKTFFPLKHIIIISIFL